MARKARVLIYDIEVTSDVGDSWQKWNTNIHHYRRNWYMLCFAYKWLGEKQIHVVAQPDFKGYKKGSEDDSSVVNSLRGLFNEADIVIAHNGDNFDQKKANARMIMQGFQPPEPYAEIDTKKVAKRYFNFTSNSLDDLARYLGIPGKLSTGGYGLWIGCEDGDPKAWKKMKQYNKQDVAVLEQVYLKMRPWMKAHPAINVIEGRPDACPKCGVSGKMRKSSTYRATNTQLYQWYRCFAEHDKRPCGGLSKSRIPEVQQSEEKVKYVN